MVLIIDFGSQYTELLVRQIRQNKVFAESKHFDDPLLMQEIPKYDALVLSGSPFCAKDELHEELLKKLIAFQKPMLCVCYGMQVMHKVMGGEVVYDKYSEFGATEIKIVCDHYIVDGIPPKFNTWMSHNDSVIQLAPGFKAIAKTKTCFSITVNDKQKIYTVQFHPEVEHSNYGGRLIKNFLLLICKIKPTWNTENIIESKINQIKRQVGSERIYLATSGGVDSSVVAKLLKESRVDAHYIFVNTGLMWEERMKNVIGWLKGEFQERLMIIDAKSKFLEALKGVTDPEEKRKTIGNLFVKIFSQEINKNGASKFLAQGTIKSDLIESGKSKSSHVIKTHHNTIMDLKENFDIVEPLSDLFKDEVRELGRKLDVPESIFNAQPFPGSGYAIRILGEVTQEKIELLKRTDQILVEELESRGLYQEVSQCFTVIINSRSVGVVGDRRNYGQVLAIRSVDTKNMMTAKPSPISIDVLIEIGAKITNQIREISRVVYDLTSKPPATIEWE